MIEQVVTLTLLHQSREGAVEVALVDDATISDLHLRFFADPTPTDVISSIRSA